MDELLRVQRQIDWKKNKRVQITKQLHTVAPTGRVTELGVACWIKSGHYLSIMYMYEIEIAISSLRCFGVLGRGQGTQPQNGKELYPCLPLTSSHHSSKDTGGS